MAKAIKQAMVWLPIEGKAPKHLTFKAHPQSKYIHHSDSLIVWDSKLGCKNAYYQVSDHGHSKGSLIISDDNITLDNVTHYMIVTPPDTNTQIS